MSFPRIYRSFSEFEREEIRKLDSLRTSVDDMMEERFSSEESNELGEDGLWIGGGGRRRGRPRKKR